MSHDYSAKNWLDDFDKTDWLIFAPQIFIEYFPLHRCLILLSNICPDLQRLFEWHIPSFYQLFGQMLVLFPHFEVVKSAIYQWKRGCHMASKGLKDSQNVQIWPCLYTNRFNSKVATVWAPIVSSFHFTPSSGQTLKGTLNLYYKSIPSIILI